MWRKWTLACLNKHNSLLRLRRSDNHVQTHAPLATYTVEKVTKTLKYFGLHYQRTKRKSILNPKGYISMDMGYNKQNRIIL